MPSFATTSLHDVGLVTARLLVVAPETYPGGYAALTLQLSGDDATPLEINLHLPFARAGYANSLVAAINGTDQGSGVRGQGSGRE